MIRLKISSFIKRHKNKIRDLGQKLVIVAVVVLAATIILPSLQNMVKQETTDEQNLYKPTQTIIQGSDVSKEQYEKDLNLVNTFLEFCNKGEVEKAYNLISDECKEESYSTIDEFQKYYYNYVFNEKKQCNLQSWVSTSNYIVYKVRYTNNILATGTYNPSSIHQDYITLNRKNDTEKISIGSFIDSEKLNIITKTDEIEAIVTKRNIYTSYEKYEIKIRNNTQETILLNDLEDSDTIKLVGSSNTEYKVNINRLSIEDLIIKPNELRTITLIFEKNISANSKAKKIKIENIIKDYNNYINNPKDYTDRTSISIEVED